MKNKAVVLKIQLMGNVSDTLAPEGLLKKNVTKVKN